MRISIILKIAAIAGCTWLASSCIDHSSDQDNVSDTLSYNFDIRPILSDKCFACHGPDANKREASLRLDIRDSAYKALQDNPRAHALVPGNPLQSEVFLRISSKDSSVMMPPPNSNLKLTEHEILLIERWIAQGAKYEAHWSFTPPRQSALPAVQQKNWPKNEIDYFILKKIEDKHLAPNPEADKERLLKRVSLDLLGLPPSIELMDRFLKDTTANAYDKIIDELLNDPAYGEKMALHWLDVARYADSHGYQDDNYRSQWPWRDWVIYAFNNNMHYDQFITWQLAGDLLPDATKEQILATGFNRNHKITEEGGVVDEEYRVEYVTDRTNTFSKALLGVTMECAHCHDHKYDPFSQKEHYQLSAFFNNIKEAGIESTVGGPETFAKKPLMQITNEEVKTLLTFVNKTDTNQLIVSVMGEMDTVRTTYLLNRGVYNQHGEEVEAGTPESILRFDKQYPKNRLGLAKWLFDKKNPLTARVWVNQIWQEIFGRGIVKTSGDFGMQGELPSHPQMLDWLAVDFMEHHWDVKRLMKQIVRSATYRQSAVVTPEKIKTDPENILWSRAPRLRVSAEIVKDIVMKSSGLLDKTIGGPSVKPYQPAGMWEAATSGRGYLSSYKQDHGNSLYRRGMYTFIKRTVPPPTMAIFDASNRDQCEVKRLKTNTPLQALVMLNDPMVLEAARVLSSKLTAEKINSSEQIEKAFRLIVCRKPAQKETQILNNYYAEQLKTIKIKTAEQLLMVGEYPQAIGTDKIKTAAMMQTLMVMYNMEETITKS